MWKKCVLCFHGVRYALCMLLSVWVCDDADFQWIRYLIRNFNQNAANFIISLLLVINESTFDRTSYNRKMLKNFSLTLNQPPELILCQVANHLANSISLGISHYSPKLQQRQYFYCNLLSRNLWRGQILSNIKIRFNTHYLPDRRWLFSVYALCTLGNRYQWLGGR